MRLFLLLLIVVPLAAVASLGPLLQGKEATSWFVTTDSSQPVVMSMEASSLGIRQLRNVHEEKQGPMPAVKGARNVYTVPKSTRAQSESDVRSLFKGTRGTIYIEPNYPMYKATIIDVTANTTEATESWALDRTDQVQLPLDESVTRFTSLQGQGQHIYIVDTGIFYNHEVMTSYPSYDFCSVGDAWCTSDCAGHGSHVGGLAGGNVMFGVASRATLHSIRVLDCNGEGSVASVYAGLQYIYLHGASNCVINLSLGMSGFSSAIYGILLNLINVKRCVVVAAAGNDQIDACYNFPAKLSEVISVAASTPQDTRAWFSNNGNTCLSLYAPGLNILSFNNNMSPPFKTLSGTSMSAPIVSGVVAILIQAHLQIGGTGTVIDPVVVKRMLLDNFTVDSVYSGLPLLYLNWGYLTTLLAAYNVPSAPSPPVATPSISEVPLPTPPPPTIPSSSALSLERGNITMFSLAFIYGLLGIVIYM